MSAGVALGLHALSMCYVDGVVRVRGNHAAMSPAKKRRKFTAGKEARRGARTVLGQPPPERVIPDKRRKPPKHKKDWMERLEE